MALIKTTDLTLGYDGKAVAENINIEINQGDFLCIVGENGSGKSTLMRALLGLKKPQSGTITYGQGLKKTEIGYLPQQTAMQKDFPASVYEVVLSGCLNKTGKLPFFRKAHKKAALDNMDLFNPNKNSTFVFVFFNLCTSISIDSVIGTPCIALRKV